MPAITDVSQIGRDGKEQLRVSRVGMNVLRSGDDYTTDPRFTVPRSGKLPATDVHVRPRSVLFTM